MEPLPPDLMARLAQIRAEVEHENPQPRWPMNLVRMLLILLVLVVLPLLVSGPCGVLGIREDTGGETDRGPSLVTPRPGQ